MVRKTSSPGRRPGFEPARPRDPPADEPLFDALCRWPSSRRTTGKALGPAAKPGPTHDTEQNKRDRILVHVRFFGLLHLR